MVSYPLHLLPHVLLKIVEGVKVCRSRRRRAGLLLTGGT